jgi:hypothetical protein
VFFHERPLQTGEGHRCAFQGNGVPLDGSWPPVSAPCYDCWWLSWATVNKLPHAKCGSDVHYSVDGVWMCGHDVLEITL